MPCTPTVLAHMAWDLARCGNGRFVLGPGTQISFHMGTPGYRIIADLHGWTAQAEQLSRMARRGAWQEMAGIVTDEMLDAFAVRGRWTELPRPTKRRYGKLLDRVTYCLTYDPGRDGEGWAASVAGFVAQRDQGAGGAGRNAHDW